MSADGLRPLDRAPAARGPGASKQTIAEAKQVVADAVRAAKDNRKKPLEESK